MGSISLQKKGEYLTVYAGDSGFAYEDNNIDGAVAGFTYEDDNIIAVVKPKGLLTHGDSREK